MSEMYIEWLDIAIFMSERTGCISCTYVHIGAQEVKRMRMACHCGVCVYQLLFCVLLRLRGRTCRGMVILVQGVKY
jgi:hypothetical protein